VHLVGYFHSYLWKLLQTLRNYKFQVIVLAHACAPKMIVSYSCLVLFQKGKLSQHLSRNTFVWIIFRSELAISILFFFCGLFNDALSNFVMHRRWQTNKQEHVALMELYQHGKTEVLKEVPTIMHVVPHRSHTECSGTLPRPPQWKPAADHTDINLQVLNYTFSKMALVPANRISHFNLKKNCVCAIYRYSATISLWQCDSPHPWHYRRSTPFHIFSSQAQCNENFCSRLCNFKMRFACSDY